MVSETRRSTDASQFSCKLTRVLLTVSSILVVLSISAKAAEGQTGKLHIYHNSSPTKQALQADVQGPNVAGHIYLFAVGANGANTGGLSLLHGNGVAYDANGNGYGTTDSNGNFDLTASTLPVVQPATLRFI